VLFDPCSHHLVMAQPLVDRRDGVERGIRDLPRLRIERARAPCHDVVDGDHFCEEPSPLDFGQRPEHGAKTRCVMRALLSACLRLLAAVLRFRRVWPSTAAGLGDKNR
jgi:hypothetical protein